MRVLDFGGIPTSLGEIINFKQHLDSVKDGYDQIKLGFATGLWDDGLHTESPDWAEKKVLWEKYLFDIGQLFFSEPPYVLEKPNKWGGSIESLIERYSITPQKCEMAHLLCKGTPLNLGEDYVVVTTKVRGINPNFFQQKSSELWNTLRQLSQRNRIVILGERKVEIRKEYEANYNSGRESLPFGLYDDIIANVPANRITDLTVPSLGETVSDLSQVQQDCLIMNQAKCVICVGIGGNSCLANAVSNMSVGFRMDNISFGDAVFTREYPNCIVTKNWPYFIHVIQRYL